MVLSPWLVVTGMSIPLPLFYQISGIGGFAPIAISVVASGKWM